MFVTVDDDDLTRKVFKTQNVMKSEGRENKIKEVIKNSDNHIFKRNLRDKFHRNIQIEFFSILDKTLLIICIQPGRLT